MSVRLSILTGVLVVLSAVSAGPHDAAPATPDAHAAHAAPAPAHAKATTVVSADEAMKLLVEGNARFVSNGAEHPHSDQNRRCDTFNNGQNPFAVILGCADSRAPVEVIFDQGIGDLFVIRVAGNVADTDEIGTIEYGVGHLGSPLVVVMGHSSCGAVKAVVGNANVGPNIARLVDNIVPASQQVRKSLPGLSGDALVQAVVDANVMRAIQDLFTNSEEVRHLAGSGKIKVVGAVYDLHNGTVRWLGEHPQQAALLGGGSTGGHAESAQLLHETSSHTTPAPVPPKHADAHSAATAHETPKQTTGHDAPPAHEPEHGASAETADKPVAPHQAGGFKGMIIPAAFIGGANVVGIGIIYWLKGRTAKVEVAPA